MQTVFVLDDITGSVTKKRDAETPGGIGPIAEIQIMGQALDIGIILVVHTLSGISEIIRQNTECFFVFGLPGEDPRIVCNILGTDFSQADCIRTFRPGEFVCLNPLIGPKPLYAKFLPPLIPDSCSEELRKTVVESFMKQVTSKPAVELGEFLPQMSPKDTSEKTSVSPQVTKILPQHLQFLVICASGLPRPITIIYTQKHVSRNQGRQIAKRLEGLGYIVLHRFSTGRVGGSLALVEITDAGWNILQSKGFNKPVTRTNGKWEHETAAILLEAKGRANGYKVSFEVDYGGVRGDVQWLNQKTGSKKIFNIGISCPEYEAGAIDKFLRLPIAQSSQFIFVARDSAFAKKVVAILKKRDPSGDILRSIEVKLIADFLSN